MKLLGVFEPSYIHNPNYFAIKNPLLLQHDLSVKDFGITFVFYGTLYLRDILLMKYFEQNMNSE